jgi:tetratricopeptide (TPR) repeat protein
MLKSQLDEKLQQRIVDARQALEIAPKVSNSKDVSKYDEVIAITADILSYYPDNRDAKAMKEQADAARAVLTRPYVPPPAAPSRPWEGAISLFVDGDLTGAFSVANACAGKHPRCKSLVSQMNEFQSLYKKVEDLDAKGLGQLLSLDQKITDGRMSKMARSAGTRAATIYYKSASTAKAAGQWPKALEYAVKAQKADPGHAGAQGIINEMRQKAKDLYLLAYSTKDSNPEDALQKFKEVLAMTPSDDETHQKAQRRIEELAK